MKAFFISLVLLVFGTACIAQPADTIAIYDPTGPVSTYKTTPTFYYKNDQRLVPTSSVVTAKQSTIVHYNINTKPAKPIETSLNLNGGNETPNIVVIDNKIYSASDAEFLQLDPKSILSINVAKGENSKTGVKSILIISTK